MSIRYAEKGKVVSSKCLLPFQKKLAQLKFKRSWLSRSIYNGIDQSYRKEYPESGVAVEVQLGVMPDGTMKHRVTHWHNHRYVCDGKEYGSGLPWGSLDTRPCHFNSVKGMARAISFEAGRDGMRGMVAKTYTKDFL